MREAAKKPPVADGSTSQDNQRPQRRLPVGTALRRVSAVAAGAHVAASVSVMVLVWLAGYALLGFPSWMATALESVAAATTLVMVFVIQHTQRRTEAAMHLKLDALIRASEADDELAAIERQETDDLEQLA